MKLVIRETTFRVSYHFKHWRANIWLPRPQSEPLYIGHVKLSLALDGMVQFTVGHKTFTTIEPAIDMVVALYSADQLIRGGSSA